MIIFDNQCIWKELISVLKVDRETGYRYCVTVELLPRLLFCISWMPGVGKR